MAFKKLVLTTAIAFALTGCGADDQDYDTLTKDPDQVKISTITTYEPVTDYQDIKEIPLPGVWLYRPSTSSAPRDSDMYAFFAGSEQLVTLSLTEDGLVAKRLDPDIVKYDPENPQDLEDSRWVDSINEKPVLKIPGDYKAYRCQEDSYGDCVNKEEEVPDLEAEWYERSHFLPNFSDLTAYIEDINEYFGKDAKATRLAMKEFDPNSGVINIELEREFKGGNGKGRFFYSLVRLDKFVDTNYTPIYQAPADQNKFGFFTSSFKKADSNNSTASQFTRGEYLNRFSPNHDTIDFHLSDDFFKPENVMWLDATLETMDTLANQMRAAGVPPVRVVNRDSAAGVVSGDLRYNAINLFTEPSDTGLLGYGPSAANPLTGEIISAYTNMYPGTILRTVPRQWDQFVDLYNAKLLADQQVETQDIDVDAIAVRSEILTTRDLLESSSPSNSDIDGHVLADTERSVELEMRDMRVVDTYQDIRSSEAYANLYGDAKDAVDQILDEKKVEDFWARNNMFSAKNVWISSTEKVSLPGIDFSSGEFFADDKGNLKEFSELNYAQRQAVNEVFGVHNYKTTLVHEIGHNLGLRHNFEGSADSDNFYSNEQADRLGLRGVPAGSSIMDYAPSELDIEPVWGPYDIAALRLAYSRVIEDQNGLHHDLRDFDKKYANQYIQKDLPENKERSPFSPITQLEFSLADNFSSELREYQAALLEYQEAYNAYVQAKADYDQAVIDNGSADGLVEPIEPVVPVAPAEIALREYGFCTDGNVGSTWSCDRHDEGTNRLESANYHYQNLRDFHDLFNFRGDDYSFTEQGTIGRYFFFRSRIMDIASHGMQSWGFINMAAEYNGWDDPQVFADAMCVIQPNGQARWPLACDYYKSAQAAGDLMVKILATPEKTCQVKVTQTSDGTSEYQNIPLKEMYDKVRWDLNDEHRLPLDCFDPTLNLQLTLNNTDGGAREQFEIVAELEGGQYMNHQTASSTTNHEMSDWTNYDEIDAFGVWFYRLIAAEMIASRDMVIGGDTAIIDMPYVRTQVDELVRHWVLGQEYSGYRFVDKDGNEVVSQAAYTPDYTQQTVRRLNYPENIIMGWFTYLNSSQDSNLIEATLKELAYEAESAHPEKKFLARNFIDSISVLDTSGDPIRDDQMDLELDGRKYSAGREHTIARELILQAKNSEIFRTEAYLDTHPQLDGIREISQEYAVQWSAAIAVAPVFGYNMSGERHDSVLKQVGAYALMSGIEPYIQAWTTNFDTATLFSELNRLIGSLISDGTLVASIEPEVCLYEFRDGACAIGANGNYTDLVMQIVNYPIAWRAEFYNEAKEVARLFDKNFLSKYQDSEFLGKDLDVLKSYTIGTDFEFLKYQEVKMLEKLPHFNQ